MVPIVVPATNPMADPIAADTNPAFGPRRILVTKMITGARVKVESGGGSGIAVIVITATRPDRTEVKATILVCEE
jgi:hypothetical protein